jgi:hypothetical protein
MNMVIQSTSVILQPLPLTAGQAKCFIHDNRPHPQFKAAKMTCVCLQGLALHATCMYLFAGSINNASYQNNYICVKFLRHLCLSEGNTTLNWHSKGTYRPQHVHAPTLAPIILGFDFVQAVHHIVQIGVTISLVLQLQNSTAMEHHGKSGTCLHRSTEICYRPP